MVRRISRNAALGLVALALLAPGGARAQDRPVFAVDTPFPTRDKPQSKLWFAHGTWWAWLPVRGGGSVWKRSPGGWQRQSHLDSALSGLPGQADVWADEQSATAVLAAPDRLAVMALHWVKDAGRYEAEGRAAEIRMPPLPGKDGGVETATIARDGRGQWWIAYNYRRDMFVRHSAGTRPIRWSEPVAVNQAKANGDDICAIVALPGSVGVIWSDQDHDAVYFRRHDDQAPPGAWLPVETVEQGGKNADDHIHAAVARDGALYVATKNSVDTVGRAQLVLRVRTPAGAWTNHPYALRTEALQPSRPIVLLDDAGGRLFLVHTLYSMNRTPRVDVIAWQATESSRIDLTPSAQVLLDAGTRLNDVTACKGRLPAGQPWIVLASDAQGRVYEGRLNGSSMPTVEKE
jgi:hypothetical protein